MGPRLPRVLRLTRESQAGGKGPSRQGAAGQAALATTISDTQHSHPELPGGIQTQESRALGPTGWASKLSTLGDAPRAWLGSKAAEAGVIYVSPGAGSNETYSQLGRTESLSTQLKTP